MGGLFQISEPLVEEPGILTYEICGEDRIIEFGEGWQSSGRRAGRSTLNQTLWDLLGDGNIADIYRALIRQVRCGQSTVHFRFRCDDIHARRVMSMSMEPIGTTGIRFSSRVVEMEDQNIVDYFHRLNKLPLDVDLCPRCGAIRVGSDWVQPLQGIEALGLFADDISFKTWPVTCPHCHDGGH